ncbi:MAG: S49 family peptidase [Candidatus Diapherotrites archaeon]|nr:S49 family peptidase [Candidatus Diapherotrites archaeon]
MDKFWKYVLIALGIVFLLLVVAGIYVFSIEPGAITSNVVFGSIGIVPIKGQIVNNGTSSLLSGDAAGADEVTKNIRDACSNPRVKAVLLEIDSPGGEVTASERIKYEVERCEKPVVAYIESIGASGAYLAALPADKIVSYPTSLVGSVGVVSSYLEFADLLETYGVKQRKLTQGEYKGIPDPFEKATDEELEEVLLPLMQEIYISFKQDLTIFRGDKLLYISEPLLSDEIANGKPFLGTQALNLGMIDQLIFTEKEAQNLAAELGGLGENYGTIQYGKEENVFSQFFNEAKLGKAIGIGLAETLYQKTNLETQMLQAI